MFPSYKHLRFDVPSTPPCSGIFHRPEGGFAPAERRSFPRQTIPNELPEWEIRSVIQLLVHYKVYHIMGSTVRPHY